MTARTRVTGAFAAAAIASSLLTPLAARAAAPTLPQLPDVGAALSGAGLSATQISQIEAELSQLQSLAPGATLPVGALDGIDSVLTSFGGGLFSNLLGMLATLESSLDPAAPANISSILSQLQAIIPGASQAGSGALAELEAALQSADLGQTLTQVPGLGAGVISALLSELALLQGMQPGAPVSGGALDALAAALEQLATAPGVPTQIADALSGLAADLRSGAPISAGELLGLAQALTEDAGSLPAALSSVCRALAAQLQSAGSLLGRLASVGQPLSSDQLTALLGALGGLSSLPAGASAPASLLAPLAGVLEAIAAAPGVPAAAAQTLRSLAQELGSGASSPQTLQRAIATLSATAGSLPSPLGSTLSGLTAKLARAGSLRVGKPRNAGATNRAPSRRARHTATRAGSPRIVSLRDLGGRLVLTLRCPARTRGRCQGRVTLAVPPRQLQRRTVRLGSGARRRLLFWARALDLDRGARGGRVLVRVTVSSGSHKSSRTIELPLARAVA